MSRKLIMFPSFFLTVGFAMSGVAAQEAGSARAVADAVVYALGRDDLPTIEARFDGNIRKALTHEQFAATMAELKKQIGGLKSCAAPAAMEQGAIRIFNYPCEFSQAKFNILLAVNADLTLGGFRFVPPKP